MGSGSGGDVIFLFFEDICGETKDIKMPRHAKSWGEGKSILNQLKEERKKAIKGFKNDVDTNKFPNSNHTISMNDGELELFIKQLST